MVRSLGQRKVLACRLHGTQGIDCVCCEGPHGEKGRPIGLKKFWRVNLYFTPKLGGHVLTQLFDMCQSVWQAANGEWADNGIKEKREAYWAAGPEQASQLIEPRKELTRLRCWL